MWDTIIDIWQWLWQNLIYINLFFSIIIVFFQRRDPKAVWTWLLVLYFIPILGFLLYLVICHDMHKSKMFRVKEVEDWIYKLPRSQKQDWFLEAPNIQREEYASYQDLLRYNLQTDGAVYTEKNDVEIFTDGVQKFDDLAAELEQAERFIHIQYYIIRDDEVFDRIKAILKRKAAQGVEVRILYDAMGCRMFPERVLRELRESGIQIADFFPAKLKWFHLRINYRNHRKIVVIDGRVGYVGGFNIGKEYISKDMRFGYWRDTHLKLRGPSVVSLQIRFALDWNFASEENLFKEERYFEQPTAELAAGKTALPDDMAPGNIGVQIITSGPDSKWQAVRDTYLRLIHKAKKNIYIQTPYFIPDDAILSALTIAARSGLDVRLMIPCKPDHPFVYWATHSYMGDLLRAGGRCYKYNNGFLHAKGMMVDGLVASYGTANMDIRSFQLNFEVNAIICDGGVTEELEQIFREDIRYCEEVTEEAYENRSFWIRVKEQIFRLLSPIL